MTTLITGGSGFVGLNIAQLLLRTGETVVCYDRQPLPERARVELGAIGPLQFVQGDILDRQDVAAAITGHGVTRIVHGAAITAHLDRERHEAARIAEVNFGGAIEVLEAALATGVRRVVQLGTGSVYGSSVKQDGTLDEQADIPAPDSLYGITKHAAERLALRYRATRGLDVVVARLGVVFGRWEYDTGVRDTLSLPLTLAELAEAGQHAVLARGLPDDWVYAADVAEAIRLCLDAQKLAQPVYHVGSGANWSATRWCQMLQQHYPAFSYEISDEVDRVNIGRATPNRRPPFSIARLQADLGYDARFLEEAAFADYLAWRKEAVS